VISLKVPNIIINYKFLNRHNRYNLSIDFISRNLSITVMLCIPLKFNSFGREDKSRIDTIFLKYQLPTRNNRRILTPSNLAYQTLHLANTDLRRR
jgi:hypothetical protein